MVFAAGLGTRLRPLTDSMPKALVPVGGHPLLWHVLQRLQAAGYTSVVVNVHHFAGQIVSWLSGQREFSDMDIRISDESAALLDTGGGLLRAEGLLSAPPGEGAGGRILVHNVDILTNLDLEWLWRQGRDDALSTLVVSPRETSRYLLFDEGMRLRGWTDIRTGEVRSPYGEIDPGRYRRLAFSGIHLVSGGVFAAMREAGFSGKFPIMDFYLRVCADHPVYGVVPEGLRLLDVGKTASLAQAEAFLQRDSSR